jgi:hypothetical protein
VINEKIKDNAVTTGKILDSNVTTGKIAGNAVTTNKILDGNVTNAKLSHSTISNVALGGSLADLTAGSHITFSDGSTYNGGTAITIAAANDNDNTEYTGNPYGNIVIDGSNQISYTSNSLLVGKYGITTFDGASTYQTLTSGLTEINGNLYFRGTRDIGTSGNSESGATTNPTNIYASGNITATGSIHTNGDFVGVASSTNIANIFSISSATISATTGNFTNLNTTTSFVCPSGISTFKSSDNTYGSASTGDTIINGILTSVGDIRAQGDIVGDTATNITNINNITVLGDINSYGNIVGDNTNISNIDTITATNGLFTSVPTADPHIIGKLWNSDGDCKISQGNLLILTITSAVNIAALTIGGVGLYIYGDGVARAYKWKGFSPGGLAITSSVTS